jgi:hypothetical protein
MKDASIGEPVQLKQSPEEAALAELAGAADCECTIVRRRVEGFGLREEVRTYQSKLLKREVRQVHHYEPATDERGAVVGWRRQGSTLTVA